MRISFSDDMGKVASWISRTFSGDEAKQYQPDIPGRLARWLFRIGTVLAALLAPITGLIFIITIVVLADHFLSSQPFGTIGREVLICPYLFAGYAVWLGWGWRSRKPRNVALSVLFWLASAGFHVIQPIHTWMDCESVLNFFELLWNPLLLWSIGATSASLIAILFEFFLAARRPDQIR